MDMFMLEFIAVFSALLIIAISPVILMCFIIKRSSNSIIWRTTTYTLTILQIIIFYFIYTAFYPDDSFYFEEYRSVVGKTPPQSAKVINGFATYPDFQGSYNSVALIELSTDDYQKLYNEVHQSDRFNEADLIHTETLQEAIKPNKKIKNIKWKERTNSKEGWEHLFIGFSGDKKTVVIYYVAI